MGAGFQVLDAAPGRPCLVAFGGLKGELVIPAFEFFGLTDGFDVSRVFLRDLEQSWYHRGVDGLGTSLPEVARSLQSLTDELGASRIVFVGNSAGGFAAMHFGCILGVDEVVAFSPQTALGTIRRRIWRDNRWPEDIARLRSVPPEDQAFDLRSTLRVHRSRWEGRTRIRIHFSNQFTLDRRHARHVSGVSETIETHGVQHQGHDLVRRLRDDGRLASILRSTLAE